ncbi:hypothetical protein [Desertivirga xinjiangensis]|uniref:hypothetical protein n=1 Tax=Desertivirga xinjiangensis TaxID=539206 RepID=UPI00210CAC58|nr:hypothetical protein [Pedobacter xinjiangensis]
MKKHLFYAITVFLLAFTACKKSSPSEDEQIPEGEIEFSDLEVNQHKQNLEKAGIDFVEKINSLPDEKFVDVLDYLSTLNVGLNDEGSVSSILAINEAAQTRNLKGVFNALATVAPETSRLSELYGVYAYNKTTGDWDKTASNSKLEFIFPSSPNSSATSAKLTFTYATSGATTTVDGETFELPTSISATLVADNNEEVKLTSTYEYKADGTPSKADVTLRLGSFTFETHVSNTVSEANTSLSVKKGNETLISFSASANGNMSIGGAEDIDDIDSFVKNANATFEIMNIQLVGQVDIKKIREANDAINYNQDESVTIKLEAEAFNANSRFVAINKDDNKAIAKLVFEGYSDGPNCYEYFNGQTTERYCYTDTFLEPRLVFKDGTPLAFDSFFDNGFGSLIDELEELGDKF